MSTKSILVRNVDENLRHRFKIVCAEEDTSMNKKIIELIRDYTERKEAERKQHRLAL
jgi:plasmid stability protein